AELAEALPPIGEFDGFTATSSGYYGGTPDHNPFPGYDRQLTPPRRLGGFTAHGAVFGPFTATVARHRASAGHDLPALPPAGAAGSLDAFRIGRAYEAHEELVI